MSLGFLVLLPTAVHGPATPDGKRVVCKAGGTMTLSYQPGTVRADLRCHNGAMAVARVSIQTTDFNLADEVAALRANDARVGAVCSFVGTVRDRNDGVSVSTLELEHYPGMTEKAIEAMLDEAQRRFDIYAARVVHRVGLLQPLDQIVLVAVTSAHRGESFQACEFLMDYLKTQAPFWKKEQTPDGARWVDARVSDDAALQRWGIGVVTRNG